MFGIADFNGIRVVESPLATTEEPKKRHVKMRTQSENYHRRVQKKWNKRFGMERVPGCYMMDMAWLGMGMGKVLVAHPEIAKKIREQV